MTNAERDAHERLLRDSYQRVVGKVLYAEEDLFEAPFIVCSHNTEKDPVFTYGNQAALDLFEMDWHAFTSLPSRLSAEPGHQSERQRLLDAVADKGFIENYAGVRISATGQRFRVENATVWNLLDEQGHLRGQAAMFERPSPLVAKKITVPPDTGMPETFPCRYCDAQLERRELKGTSELSRLVSLFVNQRSVRESVFDGFFRAIAYGEKSRFEKLLVTIQVYRCPICFHTEFFTPPVKTGYDDKDAEEAEGS